MTYQVAKYPNLSHSQIRSHTLISGNGTKVSKLGSTGKYSALTKTESTYCMNSKQKKTLAIALIIGSGVGLLLAGAYCGLVACGSLVGKAIASSLPSKSMVCGSIALLLLGGYTIKKGYAMFSRYQFGNQFYSPQKSA